jgi:hypothetical protein
MTYFKHNNEHIRHDLDLYFRRPVQTTAQKLLQKQAAPYLQKEQPYLGNLISSC